MPGIRPARVAVAVAAAATLLGFGVLQVGQANAIANGESVPEGEYRFAVKLTMRGIPTVDGGRRDSACSGALIAPQWVITAGHCFRDASGVRVDRPVADLTTATVGRANLDGDNGQVAVVTAVRQSPANDMSLAKLDKPINGVKLIRISRTAPEAGAVVRLTGFGSTSSVDPKPSVVLQTGQFTVRDVSDSVIGVVGRSPESNTSACPFDSGAPYFIEHPGTDPLLVSVESDGPGCPHAEVETTSRVDNLAGWIRDVINEDIDG